MFAEAKKSEKKRKAYMPEAEDNFFFSFWFNKLKLLERNNSPEGKLLYDL